MKLTEFSIKHHMAVLVFCAGVLLIGSLTYFAIPRESFPDVEFPLIIVTTVLDGANPFLLQTSDIVVFILNDVVRVVSHPSPPLPYGD